MAAPKGFHAAWLANTMTETKEWAAKASFMECSIEWLKPQPWSPTDEHTVNSSMEDGCVYAVVRDHHRNLHRENIAYIGLTKTPKTRFRNHPKLDELRAMRGEKTIVFGVPSFGRVRAFSQDTSPALHELEHLLIWTLGGDHDLLNEKKTHTLPGMGRTPGRAWHITMSGHRFAGRMPREIVYPWILVKPGRNRSARKPKPADL